MGHSRADPSVSECPLVVKGVPPVEPEPVQHDASVICIPGREDFKTCKFRRVTGGIDAYSRESERKVLLRTIRCPRRTSRAGGIGECGRLSAKRDACKDLCPVCLIDIGRRCSLRRNVSAASYRDRDGTAYGIDRTVPSCRNGVGEMCRLHSAAAAHLSDVPGCGGTPSVRLPARRGELCRSSSQMCRGLLL